MSYHADKLKIEQILTLKSNLTLKVKVNCPPPLKKRGGGILTKVFYIYGPNLVILA